jgi:hypothetical protein
MTAALSILHAPCVQQCMLPELLHGMLPAGDDDGALDAFNKGWQAMPKPTWDRPAASSSAAGASSSQQPALFTQEADFDQPQVIL